MRISAAVTSTRSPNVARAFRPEHRLKTPLNVRLPDRLGAHF